MASLARPPLGESSSAQQGATYTFELTGYGVDIPAYEAGPFLAVPLLRAGYDSEQHKVPVLSQGSKKKTSYIYVHRARATSGIPCLAKLPLLVLCILSFFLLSREERLLLS